MLTNVATGAIYIVMAISVLAALGVILIPNLFRAALCLVVTLVGIAAVFIAMKAEFLAVIQILVYVGAVMTLIIFAIMLTQKLTETTVTQHNKLIAPALIGGGLFIFVFGKTLLNTPWPVKEATLNAPANVEQIGIAMMTTYVLPFEVISVALTAALIGSIVIARKPKDTEVNS